LYVLTWKDRVTPSQQRISALRASVLRTSGSACTGWPSPAAHEFEIKDVDRMLQRREEQKALGRNGNGFGMTLGMTTMAVLSGWPTPMAGTPAQNGNNEAGNTDSSRKTVALVAGWATPTTRDHKHANAKPWAERGGGTKGEQLCNQVVHQLPGPARYTASGQMLTGSCAGMESGGQLSPEHSRWLMGFPAVWGSCAPMATRSSRKTRKSSSKPTLISEDDEL
jgi:hypothetical protein